MITLYEFHAMDIHKKAEATWNGVYLGQRTEEDLTIQLYSVGSFFAEVFYERSKNGIVKIRGFRSVQLVEPYLDEIRLDHH